MDAVLLAIVSVSAPSPRLIAPATEPPLNSTTSAPLPAVMEAIVPAPAAMVTLLLAPSPRFKSPASEAPL